MEPVIKITNLDVAFGNFYALHNINLNITSGRITGFIGPSGAGKTTLIRCIVGRQKIHKGLIEIFGHAAGSVSLRPLVSYMTQELSIYPDLTVAQNLRYFTTMRGIFKHTEPGLIEVVDDIVVLTDPADFRGSVGLHYLNFEPVMDDEVVKLLREINHEEKV